jgi:outer membrane autotransporter protein
MGAQNTPLIQAETSTSVNTNSWGRLVADTREVAYDNAAFNQSIQGETMGFQLGHSFWQSRNKDNALGQAGVAIGYVTGSMDVTGDFLTTQQGDAGSVDAQTTSLMAYYTLAANDGRYLDAVLQYSMSSADAQGQLSKLSLDATGLRASLEVGKPVRLDSLTLEPQAQLIAYKDSFDDAADSNGYVMSQADNSGVIFRVGARLTSNDTTAAFKPWFAANINLQNGSTTGITDKTNNVYESSEKDAKWADMSVGMSYQTSSDISVYGHLKQSVAIGGGTNTTTSGAIGVQKVW